MGRTQSFDRETVVRAARTVFWKVGFESAAIPELERATGLSRSSIYNSFGSKRGLFDEAVQNYLDEIIRPRLRPLQAETVAPDALVGYLTGLRQVFSDEHSFAAEHGCLLINAAGAPIAHDAQVARVVADYRDELRTAFVRGIEARAAAGEPTTDPGHAADLIANIVIAASALTRVAPGQAAASLTSAIALLEPAREHPRHI